MNDEAADRLAIIDQAIAYGRIVDAGDFDRLRDLFTADATAELGGSGQSGIDQICERLTTALAPYASWEHRLSDHEVTVTGDTATARCSVNATHTRPVGQVPGEYTVIGVYEDRLARTAEGWRITHRALVVTDRR